MLTGTLAVVMAQSEKGMGGLGFEPRIYAV